MDIHTLPIARPDETLYSVAARIRLSNAAKNDLDACQSLFGTSRNTRVSDYPVNLVRFCSKTQNCFGDAAQVLQDMTLAGFFERLGSRQWNAGSTPAPIITAGYGLATLSNGSVGRWRVCGHCIESDLTRYATAFWRRSHHLPTAFVCPIHDVPLMAGELALLERHKFFFLPEQADTDTAIVPMNWRGHHEDMVRLMSLGIDVLEDKRPSIRASTARATLFSALGNRGLLTATGTLRRIPFASEFAHRYQFLSPHPDFTLALSPQGIGILQRSLVHPGLPRSAIHNILLIDWLFGSWQAFYQHCLWQEIMDGESPCPAQCRPEAEQHVHRRTCLDFLKTNVLATRTRFARAAPVSFRWLLRYDEKWLDNNLPITRSMRTQRTLF